MWITPYLHTTLNFQLRSECAHDERFCVMILGGVSALQDELKWFEGTLPERGIDLSVEIHPTCEKYVKEMRESFTEEEYAVQVSGDSRKLSQFWKLVMLIKSSIQ